MREYRWPMSDLCIEAERIVDLGEEPGIRCCSRHTARGKQERCAHRNTNFADVFTLRDGKIVRYDTYWSRAVALAAVGLSESGRVVGISVWRRPPTGKIPLRGPMSATTGIKMSRGDGIRTRDPRRERPVS